MSSRVGLARRRLAMVLVGLSVMAAPFAANAAGNPVAHVYAVEKNSILRHGFTDTYPDVKPDLVIPNVAGPVAASPLDGANGNVYAANGQQILVFANGRTKPDRTIVLPSPGAGFSYAIVALAVDRVGNLYAAIQSYAGATRAPRARYPQPGGVVVYGPTANGRVRPIASLDVYVDTLAVDRAGDLYACGTNTQLVGFCNRYANVPTHAVLVRSFSGPTLSFMYGLTIVGLELYLTTQDPTHRYDYVTQVFPTSTNGSPVAPTREIVPTSGSMAGPIAVVDGLLFASDGGNQRGGVWEFDASGNGREPSMGALVRARGGMGIAFGR